MSAAHADVNYGTTVDAALLAEWQARQDAGIKHNRGRGRREQDADARYLEAVAREKAGRS
jgi:hypothetical protein